MVSESISRQIINEINFGAINLKNSRNKPESATLKLALFGTISVKTDKPLGLV
jgi:hypothetical protein